MEDAHMQSADAMGRCCRIFFGQNSRACTVWGPCGSDNQGRRHARQDTHRGASPVNGELRLATLRRSCCCLLAACFDASLARPSKPQQRGKRKQVARRAARRPPPPPLSSGEGRRRPFCSALAYAPCICARPLRSADGHLACDSKCQRRCLLCWVHDPPKRRVAAPWLGRLAQLDGAWGLELGPTPSQPAAEKKIRKKKKPLCSLLFIATQDKSGEHELFFFVRSG
ncbi:hypothetical protein V8C35DRAFT_105332 [Trichoderma chlorosporum]